MNGMRMWMMRGPGGLAPYYGCAFTRKDLLAKTRGVIPDGVTPVRVIVTVDEHKVTLPVNVVLDAKGHIVSPLKVRGNV